MLAAERFLESLRDLIHTWKHRIQKDRVVGHRYVLDSNALDRCIKIPEPILGDRRGDLRPEARREIVLMNDHAVSRLYDRRKDTGAIPWTDGP